MARKKDLGSLAALAGLAYMASRDKAANSDVPVEDRTGSPVGDVDTGMSEKEPGWESGTAPAAPARKPAAKRAAAPAGGGGRGGRGGATAEELAAYAASKKPTYKTPYDRAREEDRAAGRDFDSLVDSLKNKLTSEDTRKPLPLKSTKSETGNAFMGSTGLKKGGSVKGWGIARGARKAKTY